MCAPTHCGAAFLVLRLGTVVYADLPRERFHALPCVHVGAWPITVATSVRALAARLHSAPPAEQGISVLQRPSEAGVAGVGHIGTGAG